MVVIEKARSAKADLLEIWAYVAMDSPEQAERLVDKLDGVINKLAEYPDMGKVRDELLIGLMSFPVENYMVYYRKLRTSQGIEVARVLHSRRDVDVVFE